MFSLLTRFGGHALIFAGLFLFSTLLRSAAGPADALAGIAAPAPPPPTNQDETSVLLPSARRGAPETASGSLPQQPSAQPTDAPVPPALVEPSGAAAPTEPGDQAAAPSVTPVPVLPPTSRLMIPRIQLDAKVIDVGVLPSGEMETAAFAAGRLSYSAQAGDSGNLVLAGHDDIDGEVFRRLPELQAGDEITLFRGGTQYLYRVELRTIVREDGATEAQRRENARWMEPTDDAVATLISCYPYRVDTHRIIVRARLVA